MATGDRYGVRLVDGDGVVTVVVTGEIDLAARDDLAACLEAALAGGRACVVDLAGVTFMDSSGLHTLIRAAQVEEAAGRRLTIRHPSAAVTDLLVLAGVLEGLTIDPAGGPPDPAP